MGLFSNPLGHAGYPPGVTGTPTTLNSTVRAATAAEAATGTLTDCYISPATAQAATALDFASPPALGFGSTTPRPVHATTLDSTGTTSLGTGASSVINVGVASSTIGFFGATAVAKQGAAVDLRTALINLGFYTTGGASPLDLNGGAFTAASVAVTAPSTSGASPVVNNSRAGQASFTDVIANGAYGTLTITNSAVTASSVILASASCTTANSAVQIVDIVPGVGTVALRLFNAGAASTAVNININYSVLN